MHGLRSSLLSHRMCASAGPAFGVAFALAITFGAPDTRNAYAQPTDFYPGKNVDIVGPTKPGSITPTTDENGNPVPASNPLFIGDPDRKQQNEPSCDISPRNPLVVCCAMNDYRGVDRPVPGGVWEGIGCSTDGGDTWKSFLHPGFPGDTLHPSIGFTGAADPIWRAVPGAAVFVFIGYDNATGTGALFASRWRELTKEDGFPYEWVGTTEIVRGTGSPTSPGRFLDKPAMALVLDPSGGTMILPGSNQLVPKAVVHVAYAVFLGNSQQDGTRIYYRRSFDYGKTWENPTVLSESRSVNQGVDLAIDTSAAKQPRVVAIWRRFSDSNEPSAMMTAVSIDGGKTFAKAAVIGNRSICPFDQGTTAASFRTSSHPFITFDGTAFHAIWAERGFASYEGTVESSPLPSFADRCTQGESRIVTVSSLDGVAWTEPRAVDDNATIRGHQFQPAIATSGQYILVSWFDTRNGHYPGDDSVVTDPTTGTVVARRYQYLNDYTLFGGKKVRHRTADIRAAQAGTVPSGTTALAASRTFGVSKQVSRYMVGLYPGKESEGPKQLQRNRLNPRMFQTGTKPFHGDYTAAATQRYTLNDLRQWVSSAGVEGVIPVFHVAWTDNRLVNGEISGVITCDPARPQDCTPTVYTPPTLSVVEPDPSMPRVQCVPASAGTRDQSVFAARIYPPLMLAVASAPKQVEGLLRAYSLTVQNMSNVERQVTLSLPDNDASFSRTETNTSIVATVLGRNTTARTVYVTSATARPVVKIVASATDFDAVTYINGDANAAPVEQPTYFNPDFPEFDIADVEVHDPEIVYRSESVSTPVLEDPVLEDPVLEDPVLEDPVLEDPVLEDPVLEDPVLEDPVLEDPVLEDPVLEDAAITYAAVPASNLQDSDWSYCNGSSGCAMPTGEMTQLTWKIAMKGNTTTSFTGKLLINGSLPDGAKAQLLVSRRSLRNTVQPTSTNCAQARTSQFQVLANVPDPEFGQVTVNSDGTPSYVQPDTVNPPRGQPSYFIPPGGAVYMTVRLWNLPADWNPRRIGTIVSSQPGNTGASPPQDLDLDITPPAFAWPEDMSMYASVEGNAPGGANVEITVTAADNATPVPVDCLRTGEGETADVPSDGTSSFFPLGEWTVTCTAVDAAGNTATGGFPVNVLDRTPPTLDVSGLNLTMTPTPGGATLTYAPPTAQDIVDTTPVVICQPPSGTMLLVGAHTITCTATDQSGNVAQGKLDFVVTDRIAPAVTVPGNITVEATGPSGAVVNYAATATDDVDPSVSVTCTPASGSVFPLGPNTQPHTTLVACSASDSAGNTGTNSFTVTVRDTTPPALTVPADMTVAASGWTGTIVTYVVTATDATGATVVCAPASGSRFPAATTTPVTCTATDGANNVVSRSFTVTVQPYVLVFEGLLSPYAPNATAKLGSAFPLVWRYKNSSGTVVVTGPLGSAADVQPLVLITKPLTGGACNSALPTDVQRPGDPGSSYWQYSLTTNTWQYNWQTKGMTVGCYYVRIKTRVTGQIDPAGTAFKITLVK